MIPLIDLDVIRQCLKDCLCDWPENETEANSLSEMIEAIQDKRVTITPR